LPAFKHCGEAGAHIDVSTAHGRVVELIDQLVPGPPLSIEFQNHAAGAARIADRSCGLTSRPPFSASAELHPRAKKINICLKNIED
jgi:hypothetical protein